MDVTSYRPVSITHAHYRIMTCAIGIKLQGAVAAVIGESQVAYMSDGRQMRDTTLSMVEAVRRAEQKGKGGVAVQVDASSAFDLVRWDFIHIVREEMGFPEEFRSLMKTMYSDLTFQVKVNGEVGEVVQAKNGVRQGCGASPLIFILCQEAMLAMVRQDSELKGLEYTERGQIRELRERGMADDTTVFLAGEEHVERLFEVLRTYGKASGQKINKTKSVIIRMGTEKGREEEAHGEGDEEGAEGEMRGIARVNFGVDRIDPSLGIEVGSEVQVQEQYKEKMEKMREECLDRMMEINKSTSVTARANMIKSLYASKLWYTMQIQVPRDAEEEIEKTQKVLNRALFGKYPFITGELACQDLEDGGYRHIDVMARLQAEWAALAAAIGSGRDAPWKAMWWEELRKKYGRLAEAGLERSTCAFHLMQENLEASEVQRRAMGAIGGVRAPRGMRRQVKEGTGGKGAKEGKGKTGNGRGKKGGGKQARKRRVLGEEAPGPHPNNPPPPRLQRDHQFHIIPPDLQQPPHHLPTTPH